MYLAAIDRGLYLYSCCNSPRRPQLQSAVEDRSDGIGRRRRCGGEDRDTSEGESVDR